MWSGKYTLNLYCDNATPLMDDIHEHKAFPITFIHEIGATARAMARKAGWIVGPKQTLCPKCSGKMKKAGG